MIEIVKQLAIRFLISWLSKKLDKLHEKVHKTDTKLNELRNKQAGKIDDWMDIG